MTAVRPRSICTLQFFLAAPQINRTTTVLLIEMSDDNPAYESTTYQGRHSHPALALWELEWMATLQFMSKRVYFFVCYRLEVPVSSWGGGRGLRTTRAWRGPCLPFSRSSELHRGSGTLQRRAGGTRGVNGRCLSSSLHNRFITFYRKTLATSSVSTQKCDLSELGDGQWGEERMISMARSAPLA